MKVYLLAYTQDPERTVAAAAKLCYSSLEVNDLVKGMTDEEVKRMIETLGELSHESPIEHASFTFAVEEVSRSLLAQMTRHRIASYSVQSQRYVRLKDPGYIVPPEIQKDEGAARIFKDSMDRAAADYNRITDILCEKYLKEGVENGMPAKKAAQAAEKRAVEDARFALPNACETRFIITMNARSLKNFFRQRCCARAQWEIKAVADEMLRLVYPVAPAIFNDAGPGCVSKSCPEGKMSCKRADETKAFYHKLKEDALNG